MILPHFQRQVKRGETISKPIRVGSFLGFLYTLHNSTESTIFATQAAFAANLQPLHLAHHPLSTQHRALTARRQRKIISPQAGICIQQRSLLKAFLHTAIVIQNPLTNTQIFRCDLKQLILAKEFKALLKA